MESGKMHTWRYRTPTSTTSSSPTHPPWSPLVALRLSGRRTGTRHCSPSCSFPIHESIGTGASSSSLQLDACVPSVELVSSGPTEDTRKEFFNWKRAMDAGWPLFIFLNDFLEEIDATGYLLTTESKKIHNELENVSQHICEIEVELAKARSNVNQLIPERDNAWKKVEELRQEGTQHVGYFKEFSFSELQDATNNFHESFKLGEGGFGIVYKGIVRNITAAIKILKEGSSQGEKEFYQEIEILSKVRHPNLVMLTGACVETRALIYEYLPNGSLEDRLRCKNNTPPLSWRARVRIAYEICSALCFLHSIQPHGIVHGDLKPDNILLDENYTSKICDFGLCRKLNWTDSASVPYHWTDSPKGTLAYMDPDYFSMGKITPKYDVYSFGIMLLRLVTCKDPRGIRSMVEEAQQKGVLKTLVDASAGPWPLKEAKKMISLGLRCSDPIRKNRPDLSIKVMKEITFMLEVASTSLSSVSLFSRLVHL